MGKGNRVRERKGAEVGEKVGKGEGGIFVQGRRVRRTPRVYEAVTVVVTQSEYWLPPQLSHRPTAHTG